MPKPTPFGVISVDRGSALPATAPGADGGQPVEQAMSAIREQARSIIEAAEADAGERQRLARAQGASARADAVDAGDRIRDLIESMDGRLTELSATLQQETQRLTAEMTRRAG